MTTMYLPQQTYYTTGGYVYAPATSSPAYHPQSYQTYYTEGKPTQQTAVVLPSPQPDQYAQNSPPLNAAYMVNAPCGMVDTNYYFSSQTQSESELSNVSLPVNSQPSPTFAASTPPATQMMSPPPTQMMSPTVYTAQYMPHVVCSPSPSVVAYDPAALQSAWTIPHQNMQWQSVWVPSHSPNYQVSVPPFAHYAPVQPTLGTKHYFPEESKATSKTNNNDSSRKNNRSRCKHCSTNSCRHGAKDVPMADIIEATRERPELVAQLPEFFGEPQLNFQEFAHYAPILRTKGLDETMYFKIPRTTKERDLNIPRRLNELFIRTFGPEDAPESKSFERISPHDRLCEARMAIRTAIVKALQETIFVGVRTMDEGNDIFNLIFRFTGVSMPKTFCSNIPQIFCSVVALEENKSENGAADGGSNEAYECLGVVSLFNYHLFRRKIKQSVV